MRAILFIALIFCSASVGAQVNYSAELIPEKLKINASSVCRLQEANLTVISPSKYVYDEHTVVTLLDDRAAKGRELQYDIDDFYTVDKITVLILDKTGKEIHRYTQKDFETSAAYDGISLVTDNKVLHMTVPPIDFPFTIDVTIKSHANSYINLPHEVFDNIETSYEKVAYTVSVPKALDIRYKVRNLPIQAKITDTDDVKVYKWSGENIEAQFKQLNSFESHFYIPYIEIAPNAFEYDGYRGALTSWKDFGNWIKPFYAEKKLSPDAIATVKELIQGKSTVKEKASVLYEYLQKN